MFADCVINAAGKLDTAMATYIKKQKAVNMEYFEPAPLDPKEWTYENGIVDSDTKAFCEELYKSKINLQKDGSQCIR